MTRRRRLDLTRLEAREVPTVRALGSEFAVSQAAVNTAPAPAVGRDAIGTTVIAWQVQGTGGNDIYARRFAANGNPIGGEFLVNSYTTGDQSGPAVTVDADGDFVIAWEGVGPVGSDRDIFARRYDRNGTAQGEAFLVNAATAGVQSAPRVASDRAGNFVVTWATRGAAAGATDDISVRRFNAAGVAQGGELRVNNYLTGTQTRPDVAASADGDFVVTWQSLDQDGNGWGVYARRYDNDGEPAALEFRANSFTTGSQDQPAVALAADGDFVIAWRGTDVPNGDREDVYVRRFDSNQVDLGVETMVNQFKLNDQHSPAITAGAAGDFVVTWTSQDQDGSGAGIYARRYDRDGITDGAEFIVNELTAGTQNRPAIAANATGDFVVAWQAQPAAAFAVAARRFAVDNAPFLVRFANGGVWRRDADVWTAVTPNATTVSDPALDADGQAVWVVQYATGNLGQFYLYQYREDGSWTDLGLGLEAIPGRHAAYIQLTNSTLWSREYGTGEWRNVTGGSVTTYDVGVSADGSDQLGAIFSNGSLYYSYGPTVNDWTFVAAKVKDVGVGPSGAMAVLFSGNFLWRYVVGGTWSSLASNVADIAVGNAACRCFQVNVLFEGGFAWKFYRDQWHSMTSNVVRLSKPLLGDTSVLFLGSHMWRVDDNGNWASVASNVG